VGRAKWMVAGDLRTAARHLPNFDRHEAA